MKNNIFAIIIGLILVVSMASAGVANNVLVLAKESGSDSGGSSGSDGGGSSDNGHSSGGGSSNNDGGSNDKGSDNNGGSTKEAKPSEPNNEVTTPSDNTNNNPSPTSDTGTTCADSGNGCGPAKNPITPTENPGINFGCNFHPNDDRCKPNVEGQCPSGFASNSKGNCHPEGPCPKGFGRHDDDESGQCFRTGNPPNFCHFPNEHNCIPFPVHCPHGTNLDHNRCVKIEIINIIHHSSSSGSSGSSSGSSHSLSAKCFDSIKIAWIGKIHRGENHDVDKIIDKCLGV